MTKKDRGRQMGAASLQTALLVAAALVIAVLIAVALTQWFGRLT